MFKVHKQDVLKNLVSISGIIVFGIIVITHPKIASAGVRNGLSLLSENLIPALFPFMIVSGYITASPLTGKLAAATDKASQKLLRTGSHSLIILLMGCLGGYPIGARAIRDLRKEGVISENECAKLFNWCINPGISFVITSVGTFMLGNTLSGVIIYISCIASSISLGIFSGFFCKSGKETQKHDVPPKTSENIFIKSVSSSVDAMLGICGWVLFFSTICQLSDSLIKNDGIRLLINAVAEVTFGCKSTISAGLPLPVVCAVISFGGFAVASQISPYLTECGVTVKTYICWRLAGSAASAFFCSQLIKIFPRCAQVSTTLTPTHSLTGGIPTALIMVLMCIVFIFEVDNKRKVC